VQELVIDVRTREEYVKEHVEGALNIPLYDLDFYVDFLKGKRVLVYCDTKRRAEIAEKKLREKGIEASASKMDEITGYGREKKEIVCAVNFVEVRPGCEEEFEDAVKELCEATNGMDGFLGSKVLKVSGISARGCGLPGDLRDVKLNPARYILLTYWETKEAHEISHQHRIFVEAFKNMGKYLARMPYEEFYEILK